MLIEVKFKTKWILLKKDGQRCLKTFFHKQMAIQVPAVVAVLRQFENRFYFVKQINFVD